MLMRLFGRFLWIGAGFSLVLNLVYLVPSLFMLQVYDRVLVSRSEETLMLLAVITSVWLLLGLALDVLRQRVLAHAAAHLDQRFGARLLMRLLDRAAAPERHVDTGQLRDLGVVRTFRRSGGDGHLRPALDPDLPRGDHGLPSLARPPGPRSARSCS